MSGSQDVRKPGCQDAILVSVTSPIHSRLGMAAVILVQNTGHLQRLRRSEGGVGRRGKGQGKGLD